MVPPIDMSRLTASSESRHLRGEVLEQETAVTALKTASAER